MDLLALAMKMNLTAQSFLSIAEILLKRDFFDEKHNQVDIHSTVYRYFSEALRQYESVTWRYCYGRIIPEIIEEFGVGRVSGPCFGSHNCHHGPNIVVS